MHAPLFPSFRIFSSLESGYRSPKRGYFVHAQCSPSDDDDVGSSLAAAAAATTLAAPSVCHTNASTFPPFHKNSRTASSSCLIPSRTVGQGNLCLGDTCPASDLEKGRGEVSTSGVLHTTEEQSDESYARAWLVRSQLFPQLTHGQQDSLHVKP